MRVTSWTRPPSPFPVTGEPNLEMMPYRKASYPGIHPTKKPPMETPVMGVPPLRPRGTGEAEGRGTSRYYEYLTPRSSGGAY